MKCKVCGRESRFIFEGLMLNKYRIKYFLCENCKFLQTEEPFWLREAYQTPINVTDTGILARNIYLSEITSLIIYFLFNKNAKFLDYAGGYGIFVRLMRDLGFDFYWYDKFSENLFSRGFEYRESIGKIELLTCFEAFEHFEEPVKEIEKMLKISKNVLFTTEIYKGEYPPKPSEWWYYGLEHGQHISFYNKKTLIYIAKRFHLFYYHVGGNLHVFTSEKLDVYKLKILKYMKGFLFPLFKKILFKKRSKTITDMFNIRKNLLRSE